MHGVPFGHGTSVGSRCVPSLFFYVGINRGEGKLRPDLLRPTTAPGAPHSRPRCKRGYHSFVVCYMTGWGRRKADWHALTLAKVVSLLSAMSTLSAPPTLPTLPALPTMLALPTAAAATTIRHATPPTPPTLPTPFVIKPLPPHFDIDL